MIFSISTTPDLVGLYVHPAVPGICQGQGSNPWQILIMFRPATRLLHFSLVGGNGCFRVYFMIDSASMFPRKKSFSASLSDCK